MKGQKQHGAQRDEGQGGGDIEGRREREYREERKTGEIFNL